MGTYIDNNTPWVILLFMSRIPIRILEVFKRNFHKFQTVVSTFCTFSPQFRILFRIIQYKDPIDNIIYSL